jgi:riboflavin kinase/FMN adenylyltransferase
MFSIGNFDGVHLGHVALLVCLRERARARGTAAAVITFDPHPLAILRPERYQPALTTVEEKARLLTEHVDHVMVLRTQAKLLGLSARQFFDEVIVARFASCGLVEGPTFGFGHDREGNVETLAAYCAAAGLFFEVVPPLHLDGCIVSSSRVRQAILQGKVEAAARWLGRHYQLQGLVSRGQGRGQHLGYPTANLERITTVIPGNGVYAGRCHVAGKVHAAAVNVGPNPTFGEQERKVEAHVLDFQGDLYGRQVELAFLARLRDTRPFASVAELLAQIRSDVEAVRHHTSRQGANRQEDLETRR